MSKEEIKALVHEVVVELQKEGAVSHVCCGGLTKEQCMQVAGWTREGGFTSEQMEGLKSFANMLNKGKRYMLVGLGIVAVLALKDAWAAIWNALRHLKISMAGW